jgi:mannitol/fructose-specific phosphotransferase system IIA component (Ntr-type)
LPTLASGSQVSLAALVKPELIFIDLPAANRDDVLQALADRLSTVGAVPRPAELAHNLLERERLGSTGVGQGVAIPHCKMSGLRHGVVAVGRTLHPIDYGAVDGKPVQVLFTVISPTEAPGEHLQTLAAISRWVRAGQHIEAVLAAPTREAIYQLLVGEG